MISPTRMIKAHGYSFAGGLIAGGLATLFIARPDVGRLSPRPPASGVKQEQSRPAPQREGLDGTNQVQPPQSNQTAPAPRPSSVQALREEAARRGAEFAMATRGKEYGQLFTSMGLDDATRDRLLGRIAAIYEARAIQQGISGQLSDARREYEKELGAALGDKIGRYADHETLLPARTELAAFEKFSGGLGVSYSADEEDKILVLMSESGAYTYPTTTEVGSVFHNWRPTSRGLESAAIYSVERDYLKERSDFLLARAKEMNLAESTIKRLEEYYGKGIAAYEDRITVFGASPAELRSIMEFRKGQIQADAAERARSKRLQSDRR